MAEKIDNTRKMISAVNTPIAYVTLFLLLLFGAMGALISAGRLTPQGTDNLGYAMIGSAIFVLLCFIAVLFTNPDLLFRSGAVEGAIESFRTLGQQLTPPEISILQKMLGRGANYFTSFADGITNDTPAQAESREKKLLKLGFIQRVGASEVELSSMGTAYAQATSKYSQQNLSIGNVPAMPVGERAASNDDLATFLRQQSFGEVLRVMVIANTGQETVREVLTEIQNLRDQIATKITIDILLRSPHHGDRRRAENTANTIETIKQFRSAPGNAKLVARYRYYAGISPFRCILLQHKSGSYSGFLSFYQWRQPGLPQAASTRDAASREARIITGPSPLLDAYLSWFSHLWGPHALRAIVFDFDDTLFSTTEPQVTAWLGALRALLGRGVIALTDLAEPLQAALSNDKAAKAYILDAFFEHQSEPLILSALIPDEAKRLAVADELKQERWPIREQETYAFAQPVANLSPPELKRLGEEYALVIVSATSDKLIHDVLRKWELQGLFPYVVGRDAPRHDWLDMEVKTQNLLRVANILSVPLPRIAFVGDSDADYRSARQLGIRFIENRFNADFYSKPSLIRDLEANVEGVLTNGSKKTGKKEGELARILAGIERTFDQ